MGSSTRRIPFVLNLDDPLDAAIWEALQPMLSRHRASAFIRSAVAQTLGIGSAMPFVAPSATRALPMGESSMVAKRPTRTSTPDEPSTATFDEHDEDSLKAAANNFLNAFG